jgi:hypothetical protein
MNNRCSGPIAAAQWSNNRRSPEQPENEKPAEVSGLAARPAGVLAEQ